MRQYQVLLREGSYLDGGWKLDYLDEAPKSGAGTP